MGEVRNEKKRLENKALALTLMAVAGCQAFGSQRNIVTQQDTEEHVASLKYKTGRNAAEASRERCEKTKSTELSDREWTMSIANRRPLA